MMVWPFPTAMMFIQENGQMEEKAKDQIESTLLIHLRDLDDHGDGYAFPL